MFEAAAHWNCNLQLNVGSSKPLQTFGILSQSHRVITLTQLRKYCTTFTLRRLPFGIHFSICWRASSPWRPHYKSYQWCLNSHTFFDPWHSIENCLKHWVEGIFRFYDQYTRGRKKRKKERQVRERETTRCNTAKPSKPRPNMAAPMSRHTARETSVVNSDPEAELMRNGTHIDRKMGGGGGGGVQAGVTEVPLLISLTPYRDAKPAHTEGSK